MPILPEGAAPEQAAAWIRRHLPVVPVPDLPEIRLHVADARSGLGRFLDGQPGAGPPYWAHPWAGGLVLARYLREEAGLVSGRKVIDLGCGSGLVGIAAARGSAASVHAVDVDPLAVVATQVNAAMNAVVIETTCADLLDGPVPDTDIILVGDLFYEAVLATRAMPFLEQCARNGVDVLIGDPGRTTLPASRLQPMAHGTTRDFGTGRAEVAGTVFRLRM